MTTIAGTGTWRHTGDGGPATSATLYSPVDLAVDGAGNVYVAENFLSSIRKITPAGIISAIAGVGPGGGRSGDLSCAFRERRRRGGSRGQRVYCGVRLQSYSQ